MKPITVACLLIAALYITCSKGNSGGDNPPPPPPPPGAPTITSTSPEYVFWGDELTINGTGFSTTASENIVYVKGNKSCDADSTWQKATVVSATATRLVVKAPYFIKPNGVLCGNDYGRVRVTVNSKSFTRDSVVKFVGKPEVSSCLPYGVTIGQYPNTFRPGDTSVVTAHLWTLYGRESGYYDKLKLFVNGSLINTVDRVFTGATCNGLAFVLDAKTYSDVNNCTEPDGYFGGPARKFTFIIKVDGTSHSDTTEVWVRNQPNMVVTKTEGPTQVSKSAGGNPYVDVIGRNFYLKEIRWSNGLDPAFHTAPPGHDVSSTNLNIFIPLSLMKENSSYTATGITTCGTEITLFGIGILP